VKLPGIDDGLATRIVEARAATNGFSSIEDIGLALDLDGNLVEDLRKRAFFSPDKGGCVAWLDSPRAAD
jgi:DNA uptake protein ComE-like DNA-binding protein